MTTSPTSVISAYTIYIHLVNARLWMKYEDRWIILSPRKQLTPKQIKDIGFPVKYQGRVGKTYGQIDSDSIIKDCDEKYWEMATFVISQANPNKEK